MYDTVKIGKYIVDNKSKLEDPDLSTILDEILVKIDEFSGDDLSEKKKALGKLGLIRVVNFPIIAQVMHVMLGFENYNDEMDKISKKLKLNLSVSSEKNTVSYLVDFSIELASKIRFYGVNVITNIKDNLTEDELRFLLKKLDDKDQKTVNKILSKYRKWYSKIDPSSSLYECMQNLESSCLSYATQSVSEAINRIEIRKYSEEKRKQLVITYRSYTARK